MTGAGGSAATTVVLLPVQLSVKALAQSAMHCVVMLAAHCARASAAHLTSHPTFAWTLHVAWHTEAHLLLQLEFEVEAHAALHWSWQSFAQDAAHWLGKTDAAQSEPQPDPHFDMHVPVQSACALAAHPILQSAPQSATQPSVALAAH
jgi:hypothetical protein